MDIVLILRLLVLFGVIFFGISIAAANFVTTCCCCNSL